jgi:hypothetical protein
MSRFDNPQDRQQREVYAAERFVDWSKYQGEIRKPVHVAFQGYTYFTQEGFETLEDCWQYLNGVLNKTWFKKRYARTSGRLAVPKGTKTFREHGGKVVPVQDMKSCPLELLPCNKGAWAGHVNQIALSVWSRQEHCLLHELAHLINDCENRNSRKYNQGHGWQFCSIYLTLVGFMMGPEAKSDLREAFKKHNVKYLRPRGLGVIPGDEPERWVA